jgi:hypothetical protein
MMKTTKQEAIELIEALPEGVSFETILAELLFKLRVWKGTEQFERGEVVSHEEAKRRLARWLNLSGRYMPYTILTRSLNT